MLSPFLNNFIELHKKLPIVADGEYGSEERGLAPRGVNIRELAIASSKIFNKNKEKAIKFDNHQILSLFLLSGLLMSQNFYFINHLYF